jgi:hypothetical protein
MTYYIFYFLFNGTLKCTCDFSPFSYLIKIYLACRVKLGLKKIFANQFQIYLLFTFIIVKFFKF